MISINLYGLIEEFEKLNDRFYEEDCSEEEENRLLDRMYEIQSNIKEFLLNCGIDEKTAKYISEYKLEDIKYILEKWRQ